MTMKLRILLLLLLMYAPHLHAQVLSDSLTLQTSIIDQIIITGNKKTRSYIVQRELTFQKGDTLAPYILESAIERTRQNLMNTALFNFVEIRYFQGLGNTVVVHINLIERWYLWPSPVFEIADRNISEWWQTKDFSRTNYGMFLRQENLTGRDDIAQLQMLFGYTKRFGIFYTIPYINKKLNVGLSAGFYVTSVKEVAYNTLNNKIQFFKDPDNFLRKEMQAYVRLTKRQGLYDYYNTTLDYRISSVEDTILKLNDKYFVDGSTKQQHLALTWSYRHDTRDYQPYALNGYLYELEVSKVGLKFLKNEPDLIAISMGVRKYLPLSKRWFTSVALKGRIMQREGGPFFNQRALGYGFDYIRGYDLYVLNGQDFALFRSNLKYNLIPVKIYQFSFLKSEKFKKFPISAYLNAFFDAGYVSDKQFGYRNSLSNEWQMGYGLCLDFITYYDIVLRFEYALNKIGDTGLYFRVGAVF